MAPGQWIAQNAANGAVGRLVAQFAAARGVHVLGLVRRAEGIAELAEAGISIAFPQRELRVDTSRALRVEVAAPSGKTSEAT